MKRAIVAMMLVSSGAVGDPTYNNAKRLKRPSGAACTTIETVENGKVVDTARLWTDDKGRPTYLEHAVAGVKAASFEYDAKGWLVKVDLEAGVGELVEGDFRYGDHGEMTERRFIADGGNGHQDMLTTFAWDGSWGDKLGPPSYARAIPLVVDDALEPVLEGNAAYDAPHFTGTVKMHVTGEDADHVTTWWTFDDARHAIGSHYSDHGMHAEHDVAVSQTKDGFVQTSTENKAVATWSNGHLVSATKDDGRASSMALTYDDKGRWTETKGTGSFKSARVTYTCK